MYKFINVLQMQQALGKYFIIPHLSIPFRGIWVGIREQGHLGVQLTN